MGPAGAPAWRPVRRTLGTSLGTIRTEYGVYMCTWRDKGVDGRTRTALPNHRSARCMPSGGRVRAGSGADLSDGDADREPDANDVLYD